MKRYKSDIGDLYVTDLGNGLKKYFQHIANDLTQLNSDVIRVFKNFYKNSENPTFEKIVSDEIDFHAHVILDAGIKRSIWKKIGNILVKDPINVIFRDSEDYGKPHIKVSHHWWVWKINEVAQKVGKIEGENRKSELGLVVNPMSVLHRMKTGKYDRNYPCFE